MFFKKTCNVVVVTGNEIPGIYNQDKKHRIQSIRTLIETIEYTINAQYKNKQNLSLMKA
jgi:hypothetical protein